MTKIRLFFLLLLSTIVMSADAQTTQMIHAGGGPSWLGTFTTGRAELTSSVTYTRSDNMIAVSQNQRGYAVFNLAGVPVGAAVSSVRLGMRITGVTSGAASAPIVSIYGAGSSFATVTNATTLYNYCGGGAPGASFIAGVSLGATAGQYILTHSAASDPLCALVASNAGSDISISLSIPTTTYWAYNIGGETNDSSTTGLHAPFLEIIYTSGPCSGTPAAGAVSATASVACATTSLTLTNTVPSSASGIQYQWQSSPDSMSWVNIAGATSSTYAFTGLTVSTYYRIVTTCSISGLSANSPGKKITYSAVCSCSGTPAGGTASASVPVSCSGCPVTLSLTGSTAAPGLTYQWQRSVSVTGAWTNIAGATADVSTISATGAMYYRCRVSCSSSFAYSTSVFVGYQYHIVSDTIWAPNDSICNNPGFFVKTDGAGGPASPLRLKTWYGNGTKDSITMSGSPAQATAYGYYAAAGTYPVKQVLYYNNVPQDSISFSYTHNFCRSILLFAYRDNNGNCTREANEKNFTPLMIRVDSAGIPVDTISIISSRYYKALGGPGTVYAFRVLSAALYASCPSSGVLYTTISATAPSYAPLLFGLSCTNPAAYDLSAYAVIPITAANMMEGKVHVQNNGCATQNPTVTFNYSPLYNGTKNIYPAPTSTAAGTMTWNLSGMVAGYRPERLSVRVYTATGSLLTIGSLVHESFMVSPTGGDTDPSNNNGNCTDTVTGPYDPNVIMVLPEGCFNNDTTFEYTVHFENLGNDTAHDVAVMDTLSSYLDANSLEMVMASSELDLSVTKDGPYTIARFGFPGINLADSSHDDANDGAFIFRIKNRPGMPHGATISNRVGIYFDYADVVMTNTVENVKGCPHPAAIQTVSPEGASLFPNPTTHQLTIKTTQNTYTTYTITNNIGQTLMQQPLTGAQTTTDVHMLPPGVYYVTLKGTGVPVTMKFVKM